VCIREKYPSHYITNSPWSVVHPEKLIIAYSFKISLDNDHLDVHLLYFTIRPLKSSICFEHYMLETCSGL